MANSSENPTIETRPVAASAAPSRARYWTMAATFLASVALASQLGGWFVATSFALGGALAAVNLWLLTRLVRRALSPAGASAGPALALVIKFVGLIGLAFGLSVAGLAAPFPLALGFAVVSFVAPLVVRGAS